MKRKKLKEVGAMLLSVCMMVTTIQSLTGRVLKAAAADAGITHTSTEALTHTTVTVPRDTTYVEATKALDTTVVVNGTMDGSAVTGSAIITWSINDYDATKPGDYTATGTLTLPGGWIDTPFTVTTTVTVSYFDKGKGTLDDPWQIATPMQLDKVRTDLGANYILTADIDLTDYLSEEGGGYNAGAGWEPIGNEGSGAFYGTFDGAGHIITGLYINLPDSRCVGLFGITYLTTIKNVKLNDVNITGGTYVGGLVGSNRGDILSSCATGSVQGESIVGGLVGVIYEESLDYNNSYAVRSCYYTGTVMGLGNYVGGLLGVNEGTIQSSYATGTVTGSSQVGGLVGSNRFDEIQSSYATGTVTGVNNVGGLVGEHYENTTQSSYATGTVTGSSQVGGLVGQNRGSTIQCSYATGGVTGLTEVGGLIGEHYNSTIQCSYATGEVAGSEKVGGLIGWQLDGTIQSSYAIGNVIGSSKVGGLVGDRFYGTIESSFYNKETTGCMEQGVGVGISDGVIGRTTEQLKTQSGYSDWDFTAGTGVWRNIEGCTYPVLQWQSMTVDERITLDRQALNLTYGGSDNENRVTRNLTLPTIGANGTIISWSSSNPLIVANNGVIIRPSGENSTVTLTATVSYTGGISQTRDYTFCVIKQPVSTNSTFTSVETDKNSNLVQIEGSTARGWDEITAELSKKNSGNLVIDMKNNTIITGEFLETIRGKDIAVTLKLANGIEWVMDGKDFRDLEPGSKEEGSVQEGLRLEDIDLRVMFDEDTIPAKLLTGLPAGRTLMQLSLSYNGEFGFRARLRIPLKSIHSGKFANLYYYNPVTSQLELQSSNRIMDGYAELDFTHASDYVILIDEGDTLNKFADQITITPIKKTLYVGGTQGKTVNIKAEYPQLLDRCIDEGSLKVATTYNSSNPKVAMVSSTGKVIAKKAGKTVITTTITINGVTKSFKTTITVKKAYIKLTKKDVTIKTGDEFLFQAVGYGVNTKKITWKTTKKSILIIGGKTGKATAKSTGVDYVVAKVGSVRLKVKVTVIK